MRLTEPLDDIFPPAYSPLGIPDAPCLSIRLVGDAGPTPVCGVTCQPGIVRARCGFAKGAEVDIPLLRHTGHKKCLSGGESRKIRI